MVGAQPSFSLIRVLSEFRPRTPSGPGMCWIGSFLSSKLRTISAISFMLTISSLPIFTGSRKSDFVNLFMQILLIWAWLSNMTHMPNNKLILLNNSLWIAAGSYLFQANRVFQFIHKLNSLTSYQCFFLSFFLRTSSNINMILKHTRNPPRLFFRTKRSRSLSKWSKSHTLAQINSIIIKIP